MEAQNIVIKGARQHNLKNIDIQIPRNQLVVITGLSGSGKSSLAFDTLYAEGQRRYVESLSTYARQFFEQMAKPDVDSIEGLSPAISIEQKNSSKNPRSTVATVTEIYDYLRLLFARVGKAYCYQCGRAIESQSVSQILDHILSGQESSKFQVLAPLVRGRKGEYQKDLEKLRKEGFSRVKIDGELHRLDEPIKITKTKKHDIDVVIDRLQLKADIKTRLADSLEIALKLGQGLVKIEWLDVEPSREILFSTLLACQHCQVNYPEMEPRLFSFNNPSGACPECSGLGQKTFFDKQRIVPNPKLSIEEGAIAPWPFKKDGYYENIFKHLAQHFHFSLSSPFEKLSQKIQDIILLGTDEKIKWGHYSGRFEGVVKQLQRRYNETQSDWMREELEPYLNFQPCPLCKGARLKAEALAVKIHDKNIFEFCEFSILEAATWIKKLKLGKKESQIAERILKEINQRLDFLNEVGLYYLTLNRNSGTLSGGESQRIRLATQIGSSLVGVLYILDEPSIGLHQRDNSKLIATLKRLRDLGNSVIVVEHDEETMLEADYLIDMGPGAGIHGGEIIAEGSPAQVMANPKSITGLYLNKHSQIQIEKKDRPFEKEIVLQSCEENNLKKIDVKIPLGQFVCITGVSGSGKSTLINETLYKTLANHLNGAKEVPGKHGKILGLQALDKVINIDQSPIGRTPRSNPATYTGLFSPLRDLFAALPESKIRGYKAGRFSFNVKGGRCEHCEGDGVIKIEMHFLPDLFVECEQCQSQRYNRETLEIKFKGYSISDYLKMTVEKSLEVLGSIPSVANKLKTLVEVGLSYVEIGQAATTLSGGEAQRIKLAKELSKRSTGRTLYILDEPTTGLHFEDIKKLLKVLHRFVDEGNTVIVIEHNLDVIRTADWIIDLGPEGGKDGGQIVAQGPVSEIKKVKASYTGQYL